MLFWFSGGPEKLSKNIRKRISKKKINLEKLKQFSSGRSGESLPMTCLMKTTKKRKEAMMQEVQMPKSVQRKENVYRKKVLF